MQAAEQERTKQEMIDFGYDPNLKGLHDLVIEGFDPCEDDDGVPYFVVKQRLNCGALITDRKWLGDSLDNLLRAVGLDPLSVGRETLRENIEGKRARGEVDQIFVGKNKVPRWTVKNYQPIS